MEFTNSDRLFCIQLYRCFHQSSAAARATTGHAVTRMLRHQIYITIGSMMGWARIQPHCIPIIRTSIGYWLRRAALASIEFLTRKPRSISVVHSSTRASIFGPVALSLCHLAFKWLGALTLKSVVVC